MFRVKQKNFQTTTFDDYPGMVRPSLSLSLSEEGEMGGMGEGGNERQRKKIDNAN